MTTDSLEEHAAMVAALRESLREPGGAPVELIETHISSVLLTPTHAWKLKKPVDFGFVDFSTPVLRHQACLDELRINRRSAPALYLDVVAVTRTPQGPRFGGDGPAIDHAVLMQRFDDDALFDRLAARGELGPDLVDSLADAIADLHERAARADAASPYGTPAVLSHWVLASLATSGLTGPGASVPPGLDDLPAWLEARLQALRPLVEARHAAGFVREGHGDLHLANIARVDERPLLFDAIEFNPELRWVDVVNDVSFVFMDLLHHGLPALAWRLLNGWLERSGDYAGLPLLRPCAVYRALVRAGVERLRQQQNGDAGEAARRLRHLQLAAALAHPPVPTLYLMFGLSGSGKSKLGMALVEQAGAVRVRSDVERKRLHGMAPTERAAGERLAALYGPDSTRRTYDRLADAARSGLDAGCSVVLDAAFLRRAERRSMLELAAGRGARGVIVACEAPPEVLRQRVAKRAQARNDASDADLAVLERQLAWQEPLDDAESTLAWRIDTSGPKPAARQRLRDLLGLAAAASPGG